MEYERMLELERENHALRLKNDLEAARRKNQQETLSFGISIISDQIALNTLALMCCGRTPPTGKE